MKNKILLLLSLILLLSSCGTAKKAFSNQKKNSSDEFLIEKKAPLVMPPNYGDLPIPENSEVTKKQNINEIQKLIKSDEKEKIDNSNSSLEENLLDKIKKK
ncbi:DUF3035 domain-containing protein [Candidatus Pelagibacter sp. HIMB1509]|uniref:DUF3035 domain-containing protein n=1 Tax=Candidatus Pelagibacter sp. HIMB1509 TaxID=3413339 RepID=UPI003F84E1D8